MDPLFGFALLFATVAFVGAGTTLAGSGRPKRRGHPACGACRADVSAALVAVSCPKCRRPYATGGILPSREPWRPVRFLFGIVMAALGLTIAGVGLVGWIY
jgi:hypothetical protein